MDVGDLTAAGVSARYLAPTALPIVIATIFREHGTTGVHTHFWQLRDYLDRQGISTDLVTPFSWGGLLARAVFAVRFLLVRISGPASVLWYRHWHEFFLRRALRRHLAAIGDCVIYAQGPMEARAALRARRSPLQRVVIAVHFRYSQADEHTEPGRELKRDGLLFRSIRRMERQVILQADGLMYVSEWARSALLSWLPEAAAVRSTVITNFVAASPSTQPELQPIADLVTTGKLELRKNHRFLLEVLAEAKRAGRTLRLDVYGQGEMRAELGRLSRSMGLEGQVRLRGFRSDVREFLPGYRAYVHAASAETSSLAIIEAMAAGLPIFAVGLEPIRELCTDGIEARFWQLDDPAKAATMLIDLLDNEPARLKVAAAALERFRRDFDANAVGMRLYAFLCNSSPADLMQAP
jgi:glycosyltransferase involved in cell wall biosynthesis